MVKKLLKYEFKYYLRIMVFFLPIAVAIGGLVRIVQCFNIDLNLPYDIDKTFYNISFASTIIIFVVSIIAVWLFMWILVIIRLYKNFYSSEGYLTFTLPVANWKLLFVKLFTAFMCILITYTVIILSVCLAFMTTRDFVDNFIQLSNELVEFFNALEISQIPLLDRLRFIFNVSIYIGDIIFIIICSVIMNILLLYLCISIGQLVNKGRFLLSIGAYYGILTLKQIVSSVFNFVTQILFRVFVQLNESGFGEILQIITNNIYLFTHLLFISSIISILGIIVLFYFLIVKIMTKKLNLE